MLRKTRASLLLVLTAMSLLVAVRSARADDPPVGHKEDVVYGRKYGTALTMDVFTPKKDANGAAIVLVVSGGYFSSHESIRPAFVKPLVDRGYTVFAVVHGSQPRFQVPEIVQDMNRSIRFIRYHAKEYGIDPNRIGVTGGSAGGHLSLMLGTAGSKGDPKANDPVDRESSRVQAVACFFPPTDFLNWGGPAKERIHATDFDLPFRPSFDYREVNKSTNLWERITDDEKLRGIMRGISPINFISADTPPMLILHGDQDKLVPIQQSEIFIEKLKATGVECKLVVKKGAAHGWADMGKDIDQFGEWFDRHLKKSLKTGS